MRVVHASASNNAPYLKLRMSYLGLVTHAQELIVTRSRGRRMIAAVTVPWGSFVAAFLYYALQTILLIGGVSPDGVVVGLAYVAPPVAYSVFVAARLLAPTPALISGRRSSPPAFAKHVAAARG